MGKVIIGLSTSIDGIASGVGEHDFQAVHNAVLGWVFNLRSWRHEQGMEGGEDTPESRLWRQEFDRFGAQLVGRRLYDYSHPYWGENPPFHAPVFVVTHRAEDSIEKQGGTAYHFVTGGLAEAIGRARAAASDKDVLIAGGLSIAQQALAAGLVDELSMHISPVLLGGGARLFEHIGTEPIRLTRLAVLEGEGATHIRYQVDRG